MREVVQELALRNKSFKFDGHTRRMEIKALTWFRGDAGHHCRDGRQAQQPLR